MGLLPRLGCPAGRPLPEPKPNSFADVLGSIPAAYKKADRLEVPAKFMAQIGACPSAKGGDKGYVEALFTELPKDVTAALIKKCAASHPSAAPCCPTVAPFPLPAVSLDSRLGLAPMQRSYPVSYFSCNHSQACHVFTAPHSGHAGPGNSLHALCCRSHDKGVTIQGAISAAAAVATAACQAKEFPLPQTMLLQCPASVRKQVYPLPHTAIRGRCCLSGAIICPVA